MNDALESMGGPRQHQILVSITEQYFELDLIYRQTANIKQTKSQKLDVSRPVLQLSLSNPLEPGVKSKMKI